MKSPFISILIFLPALCSNASAQSFPERASSPALSAVSENQANSTSIKPAADNKQAVQMDAALPVNISREQTEDIRLEQKVAELNQLSEKCESLGKTNFNAKTCAKYCAKYGAVYGKAVSENKVSQWIQGAEQSLSECRQLHQLAISHPTSKSSSVATEKKLNSYVTELKRLASECESLDETNVIASQCTGYCTKFANAFASQINTAVDASTVQSAEKFLERCQIFYDFATR